MIQCVFCRCFLLVWFCFLFVVILFICPFVCHSNPASKWVARQTEANSKEKKGLHWNSCKHGPLWGTLHFASHATVWSVVENLSQSSSRHYTSSKASPWPHISWQNLKYTTLWSSSSRHFERDITKQSKLYRELYSTHKVMT